MCPGRLLFGVENEDTLQRRRREGRDGRDAVVQTHNLVAFPRQHVVDLCSLLGCEFEDSADDIPQSQFVLRI